MTELLERLCLSVAELDLLARAADLAAFPGLDTDVGGPATDGVVIDGLRARGIIEGEDLRDDVARLLGCVLECDVSLELATASEPQDNSTVLHVHEHAAIVQHSGDGLVTLVALHPGQVPEAVLTLCGEGAQGTIPTDGRTVSLTLDELDAVETGAADAGPQLAGYLRTIAEPERAGRVAARGTMYGEPRAACAWVAGPGGTYVLHSREGRAEIVRADGRALADELLSLLAAAP